MTRPLTEDQRLLQDSAREFFAERAPVKALRAERDAGRPHDPELWREIAELGLAGAAIPDELGGSGMGWRALGIVLEAAGRTLVASPLTQTGLVGVAAVRTLGNDAQRARLLPALAAGTVTTALAFDEGAHHAPTRIAMRAVRDGDGWRLDGHKRFVPDGATASHILVAAIAAPAPGAAETLSLFIVEATAPGLVRKPLAMAIASGLRTSPGAVASTMKSDSVSAAPGAGAAIAATRMWLAVAPSGTKRLWPSRRHPSPSRTARIAMRVGAWCAPSSKARAVVTVPAASAGSNRARCASLPRVRTAATPTSPVCVSGEATSVRPAASSTMPSARQPMPDPPSSSGMAAPARPSSAISRHSSGSWGRPASRSARSALTGARSAKNSRALSCSNRWSSVRGRVMSFPVRPGRGGPARAWPPR